MEKLIDKLNECKVEVEKIVFDDDTALDDLLKRARMYMSKIDPNNFSIIELQISLFKANFIRDVWSSDDRAFRNAWEEGRIKFKNIIDRFIEEYELNKEYSNNSNSSSDSIKNVMSKDVFIIHGHDEGMKENTARIISKLGLNPIILHEQEDNGRTIIEKFEHYAEKVGYAIALLSADDICIKNNTEVGRARQNVIFELGYFTGLLGRDRTFALVAGSENIELMSDYQGIIYKSYDQEGAWKLRLVKELKALGYNISADLIL